MNRIIHFLPANRSSAGCANNALVKVTERNKSVAHKSARCNEISSSSGIDDVSRGCEKYICISVLRYQSRTEGTTNLEQEIFPLEVNDNFLQINAVILSMRTFFLLE